MGEVTAPSQPPRGNKCSWEPFDECGKADEAACPLYQSEEQFEISETGLAAWRQSRAFDRIPRSVERVTARRNTGGVSDFRDRQAPLASFEQIEKDQTRWHLPHSKSCSRNIRIY